MKKIKKFQREYKNKEANEITNSEVALYQLTVELQALKCELNKLIYLYQQCDAEPSDALALINAAKNFKWDSEEFLHYLIEENN